MARPKKEIDKKQFENLCKLHCTEIEIASFFECDITTLYRWCKRTYHDSFANISNKYAQVGNISLRRTQYKLAERSTPMAIWLGKQYLGQKDITYTSEIDQDIVNEVETMVLNSSIEDDEDEE